MATPPSRGHAPASRGMPLMSNVWPKIPPFMTTERSDKLYVNWRASTEKFDYFMLGVICALCAFIAQGYKPSRLGLNAITLELIALLILVLSVVAGFAVSRRHSWSLPITGENSTPLRLVEA